jgi:hypothetical protein
MPKLTIDPNLSLLDSAIERILASFFHPGEIVRADPQVRFVGESEGDQKTRISQFIGSTLKIAETRVALAEVGHANVSYRFEGMDGFHNAIGFCEPREYLHAYGVLIQREGKNFFVPMDGKSEEPVRIGEPLIVDESISRYGMYEIGLSGPEDVRTYFSEQEKEPSRGEYVLWANADSTYSLGSSPWSSKALDAEITIAEAAISEHFNRSAVAP